MSLRRHGLLAAVTCALTCLVGVPAVASAKQAPLPKGWPSARMQLGMRDDEGGADALRQSTKLGVRYHHLSGGVTTGGGWTTWTKGGGSFVSGFVDDSVGHGFRPVFSYYQLRESLPGRNQGEEQGDLDNLRNTATMKAYYQDLRLFFQKAGETGQDQPRGEIATPAEDDHPADGLLGPVLEAHGGGGHSAEPIPGCAPWPGDRQHDPVV